MTFSRSACSLTRREAAREIHRHMAAADRQHFGMDELAFREDRDRGRAAAHVDAGGTHFGLVVDERRQAACIGRRDHALDGEVRAVDAQFEIAQRRAVAGQHMHVDAELVADHAARIAHAALGVEREADRQRMDDLALGAQRLLGAGGQHALDVGFACFVAAEIDRRRKTELFIRPADTFTNSDSTVRPAMRSAASTASRIDCFGAIEIDDRRRTSRPATSGDRCR
jgi:hypothetical protein